MENVYVNAIQKFLDISSTNDLEQLLSINKPARRNHLILSDSPSDCSTTYSNNDQCVTAFPVYIDEYGTRTGVFASIVKNQPSNQSAIFIFTESQNLDVNQTDVILMDIFILEDVLSCKMDISDCIQLTGKRLVNTVCFGKQSVYDNFHPFTILCNNNNNEQNSTLKEDNGDVATTSELFSSDRIKNINGERLKMKPEFQSLKVTLEFFTRDDAAEFLRQIIQCFSKRTKTLSQLELTITAETSTAFFMNDLDAEDFNDDKQEDEATFEEKYSWLYKYLFSGKQGSIVLPTTPTDPSGLVTSDSGSIHTSMQDICEETFSSLHEKTSSCPVLDDIKVPIPNEYVRTKRKVSKRLIKLRRCKSSLSSSPGKSEIPSETIKLSDKKLNSYNILKTDHSRNITDSDGLTLSHHYSDPRLSSSLENKQFVEPNIYHPNIEKRLTYESRKTERITICIGTWNVNGRNVSSVNLDDWLMPPEGQPPADIYVFGLQELDLSIRGITMNKTSSSGPEDLWIQQLEQALGGLLKPPNSNIRFTDKVDTGNTFAGQWHQHTGGGYMRVRRVRLAGIMMIVYISAKLSVHLRRHEVSHQVVPTGVLNVMGNKGGVCLRLTIFNSSLCFVNCHLAAGKGKLKRRNEDFKEIVRKMSLLLPINQKNLSFPVRKSYISIHDVIFVFGDMNYRITGLHSDNVRRLIQQKRYSTLLRNDELLKQLNTKKIFQGFRESKITFAPTYKFDVNTHIYDSSEKHRIPSYCDRIIWYGRGCEPVVYRSHPKYVSSDHKPVSGYFTVEVF
uniref:Inositol polyphosphate-related phosphatase domain-containing protein n=1 Tax=Trichobilharzia regenti TaxID=157069 RepID=A0AA85J3Y0_TRIRE|nr:unnamed protein product [Trichobilharzia regenti]